MAVGERPALPAQQQPERERHDHEADRYLGALLDARRQVRLPEHDRHAEREQRRGMAEPPGEPEPGRPAAAVRDQRRHGGQVIRVARVPQAEQDCDHEDDQERRPVGEMHDPLVETEHQKPTFGRARATMADARDDDHECADRRQDVQQASSAVEAREHALRHHRDQPDEGDRDRKPEAEREHEQHSERDAVQ